MTREMAVAVLQKLTHGLAVSDASVARLLERVSQAEDPQMLRDLLVLAGAHAVLEEAQRPRP